jgi:hypothetical protein
MEGKRNELENPKPSPVIQAFVTLGRFLQQEGWHPERIEDRLIYRTHFSGEFGPLTCYTQTRAEALFLCYVVAPIRVPEEVRLSAAEFILRANYGLWIGNFEMDMDDGEVRYKSSLDFEGVPLSYALIRNAIFPAIQTMVCYLPGLAAVVEGRPPAEAAADLHADCSCHEESA